MRAGDWNIAFMLASFGAKVVKLGGAYWQCCLAESDQLTRVTPRLDRIAAAFDVDLPHTSL
jgi:hypothetical protein